MVKIGINRTFSEYKKIKINEIENILNTHETFAMVPQV